MKEVAEVVTLLLHDGNTVLFFHAAYSRITMMKLFNKFEYFSCRTFALCGPLFIGLCVMDQFHLSIVKIML